MLLESRLQAERIEIPPKGGTPKNFIIIKNSLYSMSFVLSLLQYVKQVLEYSPFAIGFENFKIRKHSMLNKHNLVFLGPPGAGKGTIAQILSKETGIVHISTGDIFRNEIKNETELGKKAKHYVTTGGLVPDELVADMVSSRLSEDDCADGFILDGFPRTLPQAELFKNALDKIQKDLDCVIYFEAEEELLLKRLTARITCKKCATNFNKLFALPKEEGICDLCGGELYQRPDDSLETAKDRLSVYDKETAPLVEYYKQKNLLVALDGSQDKNITYPAVLEVLR